MTDTVPARLIWTIVYWWTFIEQSLTRISEVYQITDSCHSYQSSPVYFYPAMLQLVFEFLGLKLDVYIMMYIIFSRNAWEVMFLQQRGCIKLYQTSVNVFDDSTNGHRLSHQPNPWRLRHARWNHMQLCVRPRRCHSAGLGSWCWLFGALTQSRAKPYEWTASLQWLFAVLERKSTRLSRSLSAWT